jgi:hypothetical protein
MEAGDGAGGVATTAPAWLVFFLFFEMQLHVLKMWINAITWIVDKWILKCYKWTMDLILLVLLYK